MQKISASTSTANALGEFTQGSSAAGVAATLITADWLNVVQRELVAIVEGAGLTLSGADNSQVLKAIKQLVASASSWAQMSGKPTTVGGFGITDAYTKTSVDTLLLSKANLASPTLTGAPKAPTPVAGDNSALIANTAFVQAAISALVASSPATLDTLNELAAALGNDPNFATTMTNLLAGKAAKATTLAGYGITDAAEASDLLYVGGVGGSYSRLRLSATGTTSLVSVSFDSLVVENAVGLCRTLKNGAFTVDTKKTGLGGVDTGAVLVLSWYDVYAIWDGVTLGGVFVKAGDIPVLPNGYTSSAFVGCFRTDSATAKNPLRITQVDAEVQYGVSAGTNVTAVPVAASGVQGNLSTPSWVDVSLAGYIPPRATHAQILLRDGSGGGGVMVAPNSSYGAYSSIDNGPYFSIYDGAYNSAVGWLMLENSTQTIYVASSVSTGRVCVSGWRYGA